MTRPAIFVFASASAGGLSLVGLVAGCGTDGRSGLEEPLRVHDAQFVAGDLPGEPPLVPGSDTPLVPPTTDAGTPSVAYLQQRSSDVHFNGVASGDAVAVGVRLEDQGTGYWLLPTLFRDPVAEDALAWSFVADFQESLPPGTHRLLTVAFDGQGNAGTQAERTLCINSLVPDGGNACDATRPPPFVVVSLTWDTPVDLDLRIVLPDGQLIDTAHPVSGEPDEAGNIDLNVPGVGKLQHDSGANCVIDGRQREDVVFQVEPPPGVYRIYANLSRACEESHVTYEASYHVRTQDGDEYGQDTRSVGAGTLLNRQAGNELGTFVGEVTVN
jgi:hypothetical protein